MNYDTQGTMNAFDVLMFKKGEIYTVNEDITRDLAVRFLRDGNAILYEASDHKQIVDDICQTLDEANAYMRYWMGVKYPQVAMTREEWLCA